MVCIDKTIAPEVEGSRCLGGGGNRPRSSGEGGRDGVGLERARPRFDSSCLGRISPGDPSISSPPMSDSLARPRSAAWK